MTRLEQLLNERDACTLTLIDAIKRNDLQAIQQAKNLLERADNEMANLGLLPVAYAERTVGA